MPNCFFKFRIKDYYDFYYSRLGKTVWHCGWPEPRAIAKLNKTWFGNGVRHWSLALGFWFGIGAGWAGLGWARLSSAELF